MMVVLVSLETTSAIKVASSTRGEERKERKGKGREGAAQRHCEVWLINPYSARRLLSAIASLGELKGRFTENTTVRLLTFPTASYPERV